MRIGLVHLSNRVYADSQNYGLRFTPVWAFVLASWLRRLGQEPVLFDLNVAGRDALADCDAFFLSGINQDLGCLVELAAHLRQRFPSRPLLIGGPIAWSFDQAGQLDRLADFDHVCIGDGEFLVPRIVDALCRDEPLPPVLRVVERFDLDDALAMDADMLATSAADYFGGVIEVSRGCPFLCEFCDVRVQPDNNRSRNKRVATVIEELDRYRRQGVRNFQFACDNFIGDYHWATELVDAIIDYNARHGFSPSIYTWLTINAAHHPELLRKMRLAGFDNLFIGVESFENNTLVETAKLQNTKFDIVGSIVEIQSYGFVVVAGLIFGFDSDSDESFDLTLAGIADAGLLSGDASLLTALPGTPLFRRMRLSGRLRDFSHDALLGGYKYVTNILYLTPRQRLIDGYIRFSRTFLSGAYQYRRLARFYATILGSSNFVKIDRPGYTDLGAFLKKALRRPSLLAFHVARCLPLLAPERALFLARALALAVHARLRHGVGFGYLVFWLFIWVNALSKYRKIGPADFDIDSVPAGYDVRRIIPDGYLEQATEPIPRAKVLAQHAATVRQLAVVVERKRPRPQQA